MYVILRGVLFDLLSFLKHNGGSNPPTHTLCFSQNFCTNLRLSQVIPNSFSQAFPAMVAGKRKLEGKWPSPRPLTDLEASSPILIDKGCTAENWKRRVFESVAGRLHIAFPRYVTTWCLLLEFEGCKNG